jgi:hypothetical protein
MANVNTVANAAMRRHVHDPNSLGYESVIYTPTGGSAETIDAIVNWGEGYRDEAQIDGVVLTQMTELTVDSTDCPSIRSGDKFRVGGIDFRVSHVPAKKALGVTTIALMRMEHTEKSDGGARRQSR